jgi:hypothetical protein
MSLQGYDEPMKETHIQNNFNFGYSNSNLKLTNISKL